MFLSFVVIQESAKKNSEKKKERKERSYIDSIIDVTCNARANTH